MTAPRILCTGPACQAAEFPRPVYTAGLCWWCSWAAHPQEYKA